jgi:hypothetical protein
MTCRLPDVSLLTERRGLTSMSTTLTEPQRLKFALLAEGLQITPSAGRQLSAVTGLGGLTPADYASTSGLILELEDDVWVNAPITRHNPNFVANSRFTLDYGADGFTVHGNGMAGRVRYWAPPRYHGTAASYGPLNNLAITHGDRVRLSPLRGCAMTCQFCNIPYDDPLDVYGTKPIDALLDAAHTAVADPEQPAHHILISGGTPKRPDVGYLKEVYRRVLLEFPDLDVDIMMVPLPGLLDLSELDRLGLREVSINIEIYDAGSAAMYMRNKYNQGLDYYLDFIAEAAALLGPNRVRSMLMVGLEPMESTLRGVRAIAERDGVPVLSPFRPDPATPLRDRPPPTAAQLEQTYLRSKDIVADLGAVLGPDCPPCTHNTLSFVAGGTAGYHRPRPAMI